GADGFGQKPVIGHGWRYRNASRYVRMFQSRRSLLVWKIFGQRLDGWTNDDFPTETVPGDPSTLQWKGKLLSSTPHHRSLADLDYTGSVLPPPEAAPSAKAKPLPAETRRPARRRTAPGSPLRGR